MAVAGFHKDVEATIPALRRYARALTRNGDIADDLVQDTLVRALRSEHLFHGGDVRSWLYTILTNLNRNRLRSLARRPVAALDRRQRRARSRRAGSRRPRYRAGARHAGRRPAHGAAAGGARRPVLPRSRRSSGRADRNRDVASRACARADQILSRRRAPGAAPREIRRRWSHDRSQFTRDRGRAACLCRRRTCRPTAARPCWTGLPRIRTWRRRSPHGARRPTAIRARYGAIVERTGAGAAQARASERTASAASWTAMAAAAAIAAFMVGGVAGWVGARRFGRCRRAASRCCTSDALDAYKLYVVEVRHPVEVPGDERAHMTQWLSKRLGADLRVPDLQPIGLKLVGGRLLPGPTGAAAFYMYEGRSGERFTIYCAHAGRAGNGAALQGRRRQSPRSTGSTRTSPTCERPGRPRRSSRR